jgi:hypothetical protein
MSKKRRLPKVGDCDAPSSTQATVETKAKLRKKSVAQWESMK